jgi:hypothetical protein
LVNLRFFSCINHICMCNTLEMEWIICSNLVLWAPSNRTAASEAHGFCQTSQPYIWWDARILVHCINEAVHRHTVYLLIAWYKSSQWSVC